MPPCRPTGVDAPSVDASFDANYSRTSAVAGARGRVDGALSSGRRTARTSRRCSNHVDESEVPPPPPPASESPRAELNTRPRSGSLQHAPSFYCPLTMAVMTDPVQDREGNSYEKDAIEKWLSSNTTSPITRNRLRRKHLVPNRALREAINFEARKWEEATAGSPNVISTKPKQQETMAVPAALPREPAPYRGATSSTNHQQTINHLLSSLNVKSRLDRFGIALLPMNRIQPTVNNEKHSFVMVIEAPSDSDTFRLYTHFNGSMDRAAKPNNAAAPNGTSSENRVLDNLLQNGRHRSLTLTKVCDEKLRFGFEGKGSEIVEGSIDDGAKKLRGILDMFVKVSHRMRKRIEG